jgi:hypothetical protein
MSDSEVYAKSIEPRLAPGGLVFDTFISSQLFRRRPVPAVHADEAQELATQDGTDAMLASCGGPVRLVVYDGDSGEQLLIAGVEDLQRHVG